MERALNWLRNQHGVVRVAFFVVLLGFGFCFSEYCRTMMQERNTTYKVGVCKAVDGTYIMIEGVNLCIRDLR